MSVKCPLIRLSIGDKCTWLELEGTSKSCMSSYRIHVVATDLLWVLVSLGMVVVTSCIDVRLIIVIFVSQKVPLYFRLG